MYVVLVEFSIRPQHIGAFRKRVVQQAADSLANESNCHVFDVCSNPDDASEIVLYEVYGSKADFAAHLETRHFRDFDADVSDWVGNKRVRLLSRIETGEP